FLSLILLTPIFTLFPYTTLFRSHQPSEREFEIQIDAEVRLADVTHRAVKELDQLGPFGQGNPRPVFAATHVELAGPPRTMGEGEDRKSTRLNSSHVKISYAVFCL